MVSVIIPNYNHAKYLKQRIDSVLLQTYQHFELIILDDSSTDNSKSIIEQYRHHPKISAIIYNDQNTGNTFKQWNKGIALAKNKYVWIAESDDTAEPFFLERLVQAVTENENIGIAYSQSYRMDDNNNLHGTWKSWTDDLDTDFFAKDFVCNGIEYINRFLIKKNTIPNASAVIFKKEIFDSTGGADETIKYCSDWLLWMKILSRSDIAFISECLNHFRFHTESVIAGVREPHGKYNVSMRKKWRSFLEKEKMKILMNSANENLSSEYFKWGEEHFNAGNKWRGCRYVICSALYPTVDPVKLLQKMKYVVYRLLSL